MDVTSGASLWLGRAGSLSHGAEPIVAVIPNLAGRCFRTSGREKSDFREVSDLWLADRNSELLIRLDERDRIARELHDSTSQLLVALELQLVRLKNLSWARRSAAFDDVMTELGTTLAELHEGVRAVARPEVFDPADLIEHLTAMAKEFADRTSIGIHLDTGALPLAVSAEVAAAFYRTTQEALANASRHAKAENVWLSLREKQGSVALRVADDGVGFPKPLPKRPAGRGIANMRTRMNEVGGTLSVRNLKNGAVVEAKIDLSVPQGAPAFMFALDAAD